MSETIKLKILYFAKVKEILRKSSDEIITQLKNFKAKTVFQLCLDVNPNSVEQLKTVFESCMISLNDEYVDREDDISVKSADEFSILPPISAG